MEVRGQVTTWPGHQLPFGRGIFSGHGILLGNFFLVSWYFCRDHGILKGVVTFSGNCILSGQGI